MDIKDKINLLIKEHTEDDHIIVHNIIIRSDVGGKQLITVFGYSFVLGNPAIAKSEYNTEAEVYEPKDLVEENYEKLVVSFLKKLGSLKREQDVPDNYVL